MNVGQCEFVLMPLLSAARPSQEVSFQDREGESQRDMRGQGEGCMMGGGGIPPFYGFIPVQVSSPCEASFLPTHKIRTPTILPLRGGYGSKAG